MISSCNDPLARYKMVTWIDQSTTEVRSDTACDLSTNQLWQDRLGGISARANGQCMMIDDAITEGCVLTGYNSRVSKVR